MEAVSHAVQVLGNLLIQRAGDLGGGVAGEVRLLKEGLESMQSFLGGLTRNEVRNQMWISEIRDVALDAGDALEIFILNVHKADNATRSERARRCVCLPGHRRSVGEEKRAEEEIKSIREKLQAIESGRQRDAILRDDGEGPPARLEDRFGFNDEGVVGLEEDARLVIHKLLDSEESDRGVVTVAITGMGGIGKTTLARKIYDDPAVVYHFRLRAWAVLSLDFRLEDVIKDLLLQLNGSLPAAESDRIDTLNVSLPVVESDSKRNRLQMLKQTLHKTLFGRRYLIVLDDAWEREHWESLASLLPRDNASRCRLLITSRNKAILGDANYVHEMNALDPEQSWELFLKKVFGSDSDDHCPDELKDIGKRIVESCRGLPLAIIVVGVLLRKRNVSRSAWESVLGHMRSTTENSMSSIMELSYQHLPPHLKPCFLCLSLFREDAPIPVKKLIQVWIAHDLIPQDREDLARGYFDDLVSRSMVQIDDSAMDGRVKTFRVHDLIHELSVSIAKEEMNFKILREEEAAAAASHSLDNVPRHLATYCRDGSFHDLPTDQNDHLRSLIIHKIGEEDVGVNPPPSFWKSFKVLKVLDMEGCAVRKLPDAIGSLYWLRYLGLRRTYINELPQSMSKLENLQVLDSRGGYLKLPFFIWTMRSLRHLNSSEIWLSQPALVKCTVENLQSLGDVVLEDDWMAEQLEQLTSLTELGVILWSITERKLFTSLALLENLVSLSLKSFFTLNLVGVGLLRKITKLKLEGYIDELPASGDFPPNLAYLSLKCSRLKADPMPVLAELPNLLYLKLDDDAYWGGEIEIWDEGFGKLQRISLRGLPNLKNIIISYDAMPELRKISLHGLGDLSNVDVEEDLLPEQLEWEIKECPNLNISKLPRSAVTVIR